MEEYRANVAELDPVAAGPDVLIALEGTEVASHGPTRRRAAATFIFFTVALDMLAVGMIVPVLPRLIGSFTHGDADRKSVV